LIIITYSTIYRLPFFSLIYLFLLNIFIVLAIFYLKYVILFKWRVKNVNIKQMF